MTINTRWLDDHYRILHISFEDGWTVEDLLAKSADLTAYLDTLEASAGLLLDHAAGDYAPLNLMTALTPLGRSGWLANPHIRAVAAIAPTGKLKIFYDSMTTMFPRLIIARDFDSAYIQVRELL
ncbi:MAG: hypothetical protein GYB64_18510 [Chloroflexi bacterium]|nr:hypothetical protein [Chloroflexota bacterium]